MNHFSPCPSCGCKTRSVVTDTAVIDPSEYLALCAYCGTVCTSTRVQAAVDQVIRTLLTEHRKSRNLLS